MNFTLPAVCLSRWITTALTLCALLVPMGGRAAAPAETPAELLQKGLVEEEAHRDIEAAIKAYEAVVAQVDAQRRLAATAIFRLGESYRKLGRTNEAAAQYQRIVREFPGEDTLSKLSRENLAGMGLGETKTSRPRLSDKSRAAARELLEEEIRLVEQNIRQVEEQVKVGVAPAEALVPPKRELLALRRQLLELDAETPTATSAQPVTLDPEAAEVARLQSLITHSPDLLNAPETNAETPLQKASSAGQMRVVEFLLQNGADPVLPGGRGYPAIHGAARHGHKGVVELLLRYRTPVDLRSSSGITPLHVAVAAGHRAVVETLLAAGADIKAVSGSPGATRDGPMEVQVDPGWTPLITALIHEQNAVAELLVNAGADVNPPATGGKVPLSVAAERGSRELVERLLKAGAQVSPNSNSDLPLVAAIKNPDTRVLELLLDRRGDARGDQGFQALREAVTRLQANHVRLLLARGANPNGTFGTDKQTLLGACLNPVIDNSPNAVTSPVILQAALDCMQLLIDAKADVNQPGRSRIRPLVAAIISRDPIRFVKPLLKAGADLNVETPEGLTTVTLAATKGRTMLRVLLEAKANPNLRNRDGTTPLETLQRQAIRPPTMSGSPPNGSTTGIPSPIRMRFLNDPNQDPDEYAREHDTDALIALLKEFGAREDLPNREEIRVSRRANGYSARVFQRGKDAECPHTLFELLAVAYGVTGAPEPAGPWQGLVFRMQAARQVSSTGPLVHPDFAALRLFRALPDDQWQETLPFREKWEDVALQWGDVVEIRESNHPVLQPWNGLSQEEFQTLKETLRRTVKVQVAGKEQAITLDYLVQHTGRARNLTLAHVLYDSGLVLTSSDLTRVQVTRPKAGKSWTFDLVNPGPEPDFWLKDGDQIVVPDRKEKAP